MYLCDSVELTRWPSANLHCRVRQLVTTTYCFGSIRSQFEFVHCHANLCLHVRRILYRSVKRWYYCHVFLPVGWLRMFT